MFNIELKRILEKTKFPSWYITPLEEAIVNWIDAIDERIEKIWDIKRDDWNVIVDFILHDTNSFWEDFSNGKYEITVSDNGIWFTDDNIKSFETIYSLKKAKKWWKGYGRLSYVKFFSDVKIESIIKDNSNNFRVIKFIFDNNSSIDLKIDKLRKDKYKEVWSILYLKNSTQQFDDIVNKKFDTITRKILEKILPILLANNSPSVILNFWKKKTINFKKYLKENKDIIKINDIDYELNINNYKFNVNVFKFYNPWNQKSSINFVANNRVAYNIKLSDINPDFEKEFEDKNLNKNYIVKIYIQSDLFNENVNEERSWFTNIPKYINQENELFTISLERVINEVLEEVNDILPEELRDRKEKKKKYLIRKVKEILPWHSSFFEEFIKKNEKYLDYFSFKEDEDSLNRKIEEIKFSEFKKVKNFSNKIVKWEITDTSESIKKIFNQINSLQKDDLAQYVIYRKIIIELLEKKMWLNENWKYFLEKDLHDLIFERKKTNEDIDFDVQNLWLIDDNLLYSSYITSDLQNFQDSGERPDILVYKLWDDTDIKEINIIELKRPERNDYNDNENPISQVLGYIQKIRNQKLKDKKWNTIRINEYIPIKAYILADITENLELQLLNHNFIHQEKYHNYYIFNQNYNSYIFVYSFNYILKNSKNKNKIFFKHLWLI